MASRKKVALTYNYSENWIAGSYYVVNIIKALVRLHQAKMPHLVILHSKDDGLDLIREINYPFISFVNTDTGKAGLATKLIQKITRIIAGEFFLIQRKLKDVHHIFEGSDEYPFIKNHYYWVHDFQEFRLPAFFSKEDAEKRSALPRRVAGMEKATLILSSFDALNDFNTFFPDHKCKVKVWRFASSPPDFSTVDFKEQCAKFKISDPFFICSNQFWQHKNHKAILEAIRLLKDKNLSFQVVFTGKNFDHRNPEYFEGLQKFIATYQLERWTNFVGFIDRKVQLCLGQNAISYIQPSFFEGWSTTVEDAKYLNQFVILSDIPVHREQLNYNVSFFNPVNPEELAAKMEEGVRNGFIKQKADYSEDIVRYGNDIVNTFSEN
jgi:glycosyltransferase involved in cell wall biosynthesis